MTESSRESVSRREVESILEYIASRAKGEWHLTGSPVSTERLAVSYIALLDSHKQLQADKERHRKELDAERAAHEETIQAAENLAEALESARHCVYVYDGSSAIRQDKLTEIDAALAQYAALKEGK